MKQPGSAPPRLYRSVLLAYLLLLIVAELAVTFVSPVLVFPLHGGLIVLAAAYLAIARQRDHPEAGVIPAVALALIVAPLIRIISLTLPLAQLDPPIRYLSAGVPVALAGVLAARAAGFHAGQIGLLWRRTGWQLLVVLASVGFGFLEFAILRPEPLGPFPWTPVGLLPALGIGLFTGFPEELVFRGVLQTATRPLLGRWNWVYASAIFAVLHIGYRSYVDLVFVFVIGLSYGWIFERTRSIIGISIGHGVANVVLFFVAPNLAAAAALPTIGPDAALTIALTSTAALAVGGLIFWRSRLEVAAPPAEAYRAS
jgi:hypothetical protein